MELSIICINRGKEYKDVLTASLGETAGSEVLYSEYAVKNEAIHDAKGEWIALLDTHLKCSVEDLKKLILITNANNSRVGIPKLIDINKNPLDTIGIFKELLEPSPFFNAGFKTIDCKMISEEKEVELFLTNACVIHKSIFEENGDFNEELYIHNFEDYDFAYRLKRIGEKVLYVPQVILTSYKEHSLL
jgi:GT2 family glycosyltransferase